MSKTITEFLQQTRNSFRAGNVIPNKVKQDGIPLTKQQVRKLILDMAQAYFMRRPWSIKGVEDYIDRMCKAFPEIGTHKEDMGVEVVNMHMTDITYRGTEKRIPYLNARRRDNLRDAFPEIKWQFDKAEVNVLGLWADRISFKVPGTYRGFTVEYYHATPGGGNSRIRVLIHGKSLPINPAPFKKSKAIMRRIDFIIDAEVATEINID